MLDLDRFKAINDTLGHDAGDRLLIEVAERMTANLREGDTLSRVGGDEYVVILENLGTDEQAAANATEIAAEKLRFALNAPYALNSAGPAYYCTSSIGLTLFRGYDTSGRGDWAQTGVNRKRGAGEHRGGREPHEPAQGIGCELFDG